jgi:ribonuclease R
MMKAVYSPKNVGHFGLAFKYYTHFTSPIRRYPDLIVHRLLNEYSNGSTSSKRIKELEKRLSSICSKSSEMERKAMEAERDSVKMKQAEYITRHIGETFKGIISGVTSYGLYVQLPDTLIEGLVHIRNIGDDYYIYDEKKYALIGRRYGETYRLGDEVRIRVIGADKEEGYIDFVIVEV